MCLDSDGLVPVGCEHIAEVVDKIIIRAHEPSRARAPII